MESKYVDIQIEASARCDYDCTFCPKEDIKRTNYDLSIEFAMEIQNWLPKY